MKQLISFFTTILFLGLSSSTLSAQTYDKAIGLRLGYPTSASFKAFIDESSAIEVYAGTRGWAGYRWFNISGAYQFHRDIEGVDNLRYYVGGGATVFFWNFDFVSDVSSTTLGLQGYLGLDYRIDDLPINLTLDWIPTLYLGSGFTTGFAGGFGTLGVRYILE